MSSSLMKFCFSLEETMQINKSTIQRGIWGGRGGRKYPVGYTLSQNPCSDIIACIQIPKSQLTHDIQLELK